MSGEECTISLWVNEERLAKLAEAGLPALTEEVLAGMRVLRLPCSAGQRQRLLETYPEAKYDAATTRSIELLPPLVKKKLFEYVLERRSVDVVGDLLNSVDG